MVFGSLKKIADGVSGKIKSAFDRVANVEEMEAVVAAAVLIAAADGSISDAEKEIAFQAIADHESLGGFGKDVIRKAFESDAKLVKADFQEAEVVLLGKISKVKEPTARIRALGIAKEIANADGEFSKAEEVIVEKIRRAMR
jgi:tellurite resistance protein